MQTPQWTHDAAGSSESYKCEVFPTHARLAYSLIHKLGTLRGEQQLIIDWNDDDILQHKLCECGGLPHHPIHRPPPPPFLKIPH